MSNFAARLDELMERAAAGKYPDVWGRVALIEYLVNHAPAIRDLVRAAENFQIARRELTWNCQAMVDAANTLSEALAKLEEA